MQINGDYIFMGTLNTNLFLIFSSSNMGKATEKTKHLFEKELDKADGPPEKKKSKTEKTSTDVNKGECSQTKKNDKINITERKSHSKMDENNNDGKILKALNKITEVQTALASKFDTLLENQNQLGLKVDNINERVEDLEIPHHETSNSDIEYSSQPNHELSASDQEENDETQTAMDPEEAEEQKVEGLDELLNTLHKKYTTTEIVGEPVEGRLAEIINKCYKSKGDKIILKNLLSDEAIPRPSNCEGLKCVTTNRMVWDHLSEKTKINDKKLQSCQKSVVKAGSLLATCADKLIKNKTVDRDSLIEDLNGVIQLVGDANYNINMIRRGLIRPELKFEYKKLCLETVPFTSELFGDEVEKTAKEVEEMSKIGQKMHFTKSYRGKMTQKMLPSHRSSPYPQARTGYYSQRQRTNYNNYNNNYPNKTNQRYDDNGNRKNYQRRGNPKGKK